MHASGLEGPIPSNLSLLSNLVQLVLRNCNITGELPAYIWKMQNLEML
ncbi:putative LRR receptor-like serine/threonine-protein kinase RFK1 isoform X1 [Senna tora]|uniref:Putative LRR receptor-like serine/threonine-protein kinase RFK1 isoform X1 n=1 Tax=Senna tora TaxID=362788 RepID=A0A834X9T8_9FABA|nr:putative LRR receptor-like serine/threonine-protein kinase RFK1 isoform X1 [Senna tora]